MSGLLDRIAELEAEVAHCEEQSHWGKCAFCGFRLDMRRPHWEARMSAHFETCELHPLAVKMRVLREQRDRLLGGVKTALARLGEISELLDVDSYGIERKLQALVEEMEVE